MNRNNLNYRSALNVAEKPSVAKSVSEILSKRNFSKIHSNSKFNPVFQFDYLIGDCEYRMIFTSVRGHMMGHDFGTEHKQWITERIKDLFDADIYKSVAPDCRPIEQNLKEYARQADTLILWLDCDREGENIAFEVIDIVRSTNPRINILRAHFSALTQRDIQNAAHNLQPPNKNLSDAVEIRQKIDLIIGASFTRLQTLSFRQVFFGQSAISSKEGCKTVISYGPCQFPTLNFIVERTEKIRKFIPEEFYFIELKLTKRIDDKEYHCEFNWKRNRLFDKLITLTLYEKVHEAGTAKIIAVKSNPKTRLRPVPLNTVEMQKLISKKLKISSHEAMEIAEKLYQKGYISYPRTETQKFGKNELPLLKKLVEEQSNSEVWGEYAQRMLEEEGKYVMPRNGKLDDGAHPPIHPVKHVNPNELNEKERKVYELLVRHFLACLSPDAKGQETVVDLEMGGEYFSSKGLIIQDHGYLEVYPYDKWSDTYIPNFNVGEEYIPSRLFFQSGKTTPPSFMTEAELIGLMDKYGIGTDATIHEHIKHIQERGYVIQQGSIFKPTLNGTALIKSYEYLGVELYKPYLRAAMERDMKEVCDGKKEYCRVFNEMKREMKNIFDKVYDLIPRMREFIGRFLIENNNYNNELNLSMNMYINRRNNNNPNNDRENNNSNNNADNNDDDNFGGGRGNGRGRGRGNRGGRGGGGGVARENKKKKKKKDETNYDELDSDNDNGKYNTTNTVQSNIRNNENNSNYNTYNYNNNSGIKSISTFNEKKSNNNNIVKQELNMNNFVYKKSDTSAFTGNSTNVTRNTNYQHQSNNFPNSYSSFTSSNNIQSVQSNNNFPSRPNNNNPGHNGNNNFSNNNDSSSSSIAACVKCGQSMRLAKNKTNQTYFLGCTGYPNCKYLININNPTQCSISNKKCNKCLNLNQHTFLYELTFADGGNSEYQCFNLCLTKNESGPGNKVQQFKRKFKNEEEDNGADKRYKQNQFKKNLVYKPNTNNKYSQEEDFNNCQYDDFFL